MPDDAAEVLPDAQIEFVVGRDNSGKSAPSDNPTLIGSPHHMQEGPARIGIIQCMNGFNDAALRYLILSLNAYQSEFQLEFVPSDRNDPFLSLLAGTESLARSAIESDFQQFSVRFRAYLDDLIHGYDLAGEPPDKLLIVTRASFADNYYHTTIGDVGILALGNWKRDFSPPSILEFLLILILREGVWTVCPEITSSHLGTRGCLFDFCPSISDLRQMVLVGVICESCQQIMSTSGHEELAHKIRPILSREWIGDRSKPASPASVCAKLGHDLFITAGLKPSLTETLRSTLVQEGTKQILAVAGAVLVALLIIILGLHASSSSGAGGGSTPSPSPSKATPLRGPASSSPK